MHPDIADDRAKALQIKTLQNSIIARLRQNGVDPIVKIGLGRVVAAGDKLLGGAICQQAFDLRTKRIEFAFSRSHRSSEFHTLRSLEAQSLLGTLRNQVAFDFRRNKRLISSHS